MLARETQLPKTFYVIGPVPPDEIQPSGAYVLQDRLGRTLWENKVRTGRMLLDNQWWAARKRALAVSGQPFWARRRRPQTRWLLGIANVCLVLVCTCLLRLPGKFLP